MRIIKAPDDIMQRDVGSTTVFLAGSIAMGDCEDWQAETTQKLDEYGDCELTIFNPRRDNFDKDLKQTIDEPVLKEQIEWELNAMEEANYILMYFHPDTLAPITMMELGLHADEICKLVVCCPDGFWRQANVEIVCKRYGVPFYKDLDDAIDEIKLYIDTDNGICRF